MTIEEKIKKFKIDLLRKLPFYGDILLMMPIVRNDKIPTAQTNGRKIEYNGHFLESMSDGQCNFIIMHEVFHVLLHHCSRSKGRNPQFWNIAADLVVNDMLLKLQYDMRRYQIKFEKPDNGLFDSVGLNDTVESIYERIAQANNYSVPIDKKLILNTGNKKLAEIPDDLIIIEGSKNEGKMFPIDAGKHSDGSDGLSETMIDQVIHDAINKNRGTAGSFFAPRELLLLDDAKKLNWKSLLKDLLQEEINDESSYTTPERKYIHMDLLLPGYSLTEEKLEEVWAFVDSSGSIGDREMKEFITQLFRISKEFKCVFNICYWNTSVSDVYMNIPDEKALLKAVPKHSGGTNINCVYRWINENKIKPEVMLILTDGYFGKLDDSVFRPSLRGKTILVLSEGIMINDDMKKIGKIARL
ncbi:MAG: hypothetical protein J6X34_05560 [Clostridia bacterium]|nr:hypothetical protein [Clostridia bacterium]MBP5780685.1 hypothetical protein [Clostridia bacterium]